jgi:hypothetical protein
MSFSVSLAMRQRYVPSAGVRRGRASAGTLFARFCGERAG